jgi:hypothetical protein
MAGSQSVDFPAVEWLRENLNTSWKKALTGSFSVKKALPPKDFNSMACWSSGKTPYFLYGIRGSNPLHVTKFAFLVYWIAQMSTEHLEEVRVL